MDKAQTVLTSEVDTVLTPIARTLSHRADAILDLREAAARRSDPGLCIRCYFKLLANVRPEAKPAATPLRRWLERHLEVVARDPGRQELERLPIDLETDGMESYCRQIMDTFRYDRGYQDLPTIELSFEFKDSMAVA